jgi:hypothetical protein
MLALQKNVPFFVEYAPLDFSVPQSAEKDVVPRPRKTSLSGNFLLQHPPSLSRAN